MHDPYAPPQSAPPEPALSANGITCPACGATTSYWSNFIQYVPNRFRCNHCQQRLKHHRADLPYYLAFFPVAVPLVFLDGMALWIYGGVYLAVGMLVYSWLIAHFRKTRRLAAV